MKKYFRLFILFILVFSLSCKDDNESLNFKNDIKITNLVCYPDESIMMTFSLTSTGGNPPYTYHWITPDTLVGKGPFTINITNNPLLELEAIDANLTKIKFQYTVQKDTIDPLKYDYRNSFLGFYNCQVVHRWAEFSDGTFISHEEIYRDTIEVTKNSDFTKINISDKPNLKMDYKDSTFEGYHLNGKFYQDSISLYDFVTPAGLHNFSYKGKKIIK